MNKKDRKHNPTKSDEFSIVISTIILIGVFLLLLLLPNHCRSQSVYTSLQFDPTILTGGPRVDLLIKNIDINTSYCIGKPLFYNSNTLEYDKVILNQYQLGLGYHFKNYSDEELIVSIFGSYNTISHKYWKNSYGISILIKIYKRFYITLNEDVILWSTKIGFGIKL